MDTLLVRGDHALDGRGLPAAISGERELVQRALIRLSVRRGSFAQDLTLGSELHRLAGARSAALERLALSYVQEALAPMREVTVTGVRVDRRADASLLVTAELGARGQPVSLEVEVR